MPAKIACPHCGKRLNFAKPPKKMTAGESAAVGVQSSVDSPAEVSVQEGASAPVSRSTMLLALLLGVLIGAAGLFVISRFAVRNPTSIDDASTD